MPRASAGAGAVIAAAPTAATVARTANVFLMSILLQSLRNNASALMMVAREPVRQRENALNFSHEKILRRGTKSPLLGFVSVGEARAQAPSTFFFLRGMSAGFACAARTIEARHAAMAGGVAGRSRLRRGHWRSDLHEVARREEGGGSL